MSIEVILFTIVGMVSVAAAIGMLLSENAVHSALFLIVNFTSVAFLFVMLDAAFLAIVQIAVYAGAIMVLFLFVIMLLGAEHVMAGDTRQFRWLPRGALVLALILMLVMSWALTQGEIDDRELPPSDPMLRIAHLAPDVGPADFYLDDMLVAEGLAFSGRTEDDATISAFTEVEAGEYRVGVVTGDDTEPLPLGTVSLEPGSISTLFVYGERLPQMVLVDEDVTGLDGRDSRLTVFNAYDQTVNLVRVDSDFRFDDAEEAANAPVIVAGLAPGSAAEPQVIEAGSPRWVFVTAEEQAVVEAEAAEELVADTEGETESEAAPAAAQEMVWMSTDNILARMEGLELERRGALLLILAAERDAISGETVVPVALPLDTPIKPMFGSPEAVGESLFINYLLPFEMVAILLLAAMVGAIVLTQRAGIKPKPGRPTRRKVSRPLTSVIATQTGHAVNEPQPQLPEEIKG